MAIYLFKLIRRKLREREAQKDIPTTNDSHLVPEPAEETARQKAEARQRNIRQLKLMLGLVLPNFLAAMDVTIVAPAIPLISSYFGMPTHFTPPSFIDLGTDMNFQTSYPEASIGL
jgi:hypothetical protein